MVNLNGQGIYMKLNKKTFIIFCIIAFIGTGMVLPSVFPGKERNLTILPKDISDQKLDSIMQAYSIGLGVQCNFCHIKNKDISDSLDYASDNDPMKANAREMMQLVIDINTRYFYFDKSVKPVYLNTVTCKTCHRGEPIPPIH